MSSPAFTLSVPADEPYRDLVADTVRAYLRLSERDTSSSADAFAARVAEAVTGLAGAGTDIDVKVVATASGVDVHLNCGASAETLTHTAAAGDGPQAAG
jgi:hypothetical protein